MAVLLPDGSHPAEAEILGTNIYPDAVDQSPISWSPENPTLWLDPAPYTLRAIAGKDPELRSDSQRVVLEEGAPRAALVLRLKPSVGIEGKVLVADGETPDSVVVHCLAMSSVRPPSLQELQEEGETQRLGEDSSFAFKDLRPGAYWIGASFPQGGEVRASATIEVADRMARLDLQLPPLDPSEYVVLRVHGPGWEPLSDVDILGAMALKREDGSYWVLHQDRVERDEEQGEYSITVGSRRYGLRTIKFRRGKNSEITVQFSDPGTLEVVVAGYEGSRFERKTNVHIEGQDGEPVFIAYGVKLDTQGRTTLRPLAPGSYQVVLSLSNRGGHLPVLRAPVTIQSGRNNLSLPLPTLHALTMVVDDRRTVSTLRLYRGGEWSWQGLERPVADDGRVTFEDLPAGVYQLSRMNEEGGQEMTVTVPAPGPVRFEPAPLKALRVWGIEPDGFLSASGLKEGDLIVGAEGKEFENPLQMQTVLVELAKQDRATFLVEREGARMEVTLDPRKLLTHEGLGGMLEPASR